MQVGSVVGSYSEQRQLPFCATVLFRALTAHALAKLLGTVDVQQLRNGILRDVAASSISCSPFARCCCPADASVALPLGNQFAQDEDSQAILEDTFLVYGKPARV